MVIDLVCLALSLIFFWSTLIVILGLIHPLKRYAQANEHLKFAVLICARNEESVISLPIKSVKMADYPRDKREIIVLADNCTDATAERARAAGAIVWEKTTPSRGKGDVLAWGIERLRKEGDYDVVAVFDADNVVSHGWFHAANNALQAGEKVITGRRFASNGRHSIIAGWYAIYWALMNELSNRVRTTLALSGKLTGTGFACRMDVINQVGWQTRTLVEDVEFTVQLNLAGGRVAYVPEAEYADEQPEKLHLMWRQLSRWSTGGWQVVWYYFRPWVGRLFHRPSLRLFDCFLCILTGMSVAFILLTNVIAFIWRVSSATEDNFYALRFFCGVFFFVFVMGWLTAAIARALSSPRRRPHMITVLTFPIFSLIQSMTVLWALVHPTVRWKPIPHGTSQQKD